MTLDEIQTSIQFELWVVPVINGTQLSTGIIISFESTGIKGEYNYIQNETFFKIHIRDQSRPTDLDFHLKRGCANIANIVQVAKDGTALLKINFFNGSVIEMGEVEIGIDERIVTTAKRNGFRFSKTEELTQLLNDRCLIAMDEPIRESLFLIMVGAATDVDFEVNEDDFPKLEEFEQKQIKAFSIYGESFKIPVEKRKISKKKEIFFATKLIYKQGKTHEGGLRLAKGRLIFSDFTKTGAIKTLAFTSMSKLLQDKDSYLKKWDEFGAKEGELLLNKAKAVGKLEYHSAEIDNGVKFFFEKVLPDQLKENEELEITSEEPIYIKNPELTWDDYTAYLEEEFKSGQKHTTKTTSAKIISIAPNSLRLNLPEVIPDEGHFLIFSINGDKIQLKRRMDARKRIVEGRSANPLLGLLIEEGGELPEIQRTTKLKPLTPFVTEKIFNEHPPTDIQIKAIEAALNTPDITLIQGPPGTGKTTVITAIIERLNEMHDKGKSIRGEILVTGFQHDAVENILSRLSVNGLPAVKFGKQGVSEYTENSVRKKITTWCSDIVGEIQAKNPQIIETAEQQKLSELFFLYSNSPSTTNAKSLLDLLLKLPRNILPPPLFDKASQLLEKLYSEIELTQSLGLDRLKLIRSFRISEAGFRDDGKEKSADILENFVTVLQESEIKSLRKSILWKDSTTLDFIPDLKNIKIKLLSLYVPQPHFRIEKPREDILELFAQVSVQLKNRNTRANQADVILAEFLHELKDNPDGIRESLEDYNYVFAATTQQSEGKDIRQAKKKFKDEFVKYDTVIVDEAARVSPRDLLIPMAQAEKRIILVGDHRQLPHIIDEEVVKELVGGNDLVNNKSEPDYVRESMFGYLKQRLERLSAKDQIPRVITLDAQYRMHPVLGEFVSNNFYKAYGESFKSPLPAKYFEQKLEGAGGTPAVWLNVANNVGSENRKANGSRVRVVEAEAIAIRLKKWLDSAEGEKLSFGVISFYKAQVYAINKALSKHSVTHKLLDGQEWKISEEYEFLEKEEDGNVQKTERLRIGTVDSFQGMEFDVVFLSMVRTQNMKNKPAYLKKRSEKDQMRSLFGHLVSENRLCVSMSRQKKLLVLVGDSEMVQSELGKSAVPALSNFFDLCKHYGVIL